MAPTDWTQGAAKWAAVAVLGAASITGMAWSILTRYPAPDAAPPSATTAGQRSVALAHDPGVGVPVIPTATPAPVGPGRFGSARVGAATPDAAANVPEPASDAPRLVSSDAEGPSEQVSPASLARRINLNTATAAELELLPGIGPALAARILEDRRQNGPFRTVEDLDRVRGIGPRTLEKIRPLVAVE